jgi:signal transduction histidine kinase
LIVAILRKFPIVFTALALALAAVFVLLERSRERQGENENRVAHTEKVLAELSSMQSALMESALAGRGYVVGGDKRYAQIQQQAEATMRKQLDIVGLLTADNPSQVERVRRLREAAQMSTAASRRLIEIREKQGEAAAARAFSETDPGRHLEAARMQIRQMSDEQQALLARRGEWLHESERALWLASAACALLVFGLLMTAYLLLRRYATQRQSLERQLTRKNSELADASRLKSEFLAHMSHELRTPLNAILGYTGTMLMKLPGPLTADQQNQLQIVQKSARHLLSLINELLDVAKIESGKVEIHLEVVLCREIIEQVISTLRPLAEGKNIRLEARFPEQPVHARADRRAFSQILINLTNNAIKFTEKGSVTLELDERAETTGGMAMVAVVDTGPGVRPEEQPKLFRAFEQLSSAKSKTEGTGLGLYVSGRLAALLGGRIDFDSVYGKGSRFTLLVPKA